MAAAAPRSTVVVALSLETAESAAFEFSDRTVLRFTTQTMATTA